MDPNHKAYVAQFKQHLINQLDQAQAALQNVVKLHPEYEPQCTGGYLLMHRIKCAIRNEADKVGPPSAWEERADEENPTPLDKLTPPDQEGKDKPSPAQSTPSRKPEPALPPSKSAPTTSKNKRG